MKLYSQLLLQGLGGTILRRTIVSVQRGTCAIIKAECCVYIPDLSGYISATLDDMKGQVKIMSNDNLPFAILVLSWVKGDCWKTIFTIVIVALIVLLCGPFILQCIMNFVTQRLIFSQIRGQRVRVEYILWMMLILWVKSIKRGEWRRKQTEQAPSLEAGLHLGPNCGLWARHPVSMETTYQLENQALWMEEPQGSYIDSLLPKRIP